MMEKEEAQRLVDAANQALAVANQAVVDLRVGGWHPILTRNSDWTQPSGKVTASRTISESIQ